MKANQLIISPMTPDYGVTTNSVAAKVNELIDAHNALVRHVFASEKQDVQGVPVRNFISQSRPAEDDGARYYSIQRTDRAEQSRMCHNLLIAWKHTCRHVFNEVLEPLAGMFKCKTCGLPVIPSGD